MFEATAGLSRRNFLSQASYFGAFYSLVARMPLPAIAASHSDDPRIAQIPLVDAGFASVRKIGDGLYATISDPSKGLSTMCNGGFLYGKDAALLIEGFVTPAGASFQLDALHKVAQVPAAGALDTHYHFDHSLGNSFYGANGIQLWAHSAVAQRITESYAPLQGRDRAAVVAPFQKRLEDAKSDVAKQHAQSDLTAMGNVYDLVKKSALTLPNRSLDPAKLPLNIDLGHLPIVIETYPGHSGTDLVVRVPDQKRRLRGRFDFQRQVSRLLRRKSYHLWLARLVERLSLSGTRTRFSFLATARSVVKKVFNNFLTFLTISPIKHRKCTSSVYPLPTRRIVM